MIRLNTKTMIVAFLSVISSSTLSISEEKDVGAYISQFFSIGDIIVNLESCENIDLKDSENGYRVSDFISGYVRHFTSGDSNKRGSFQCQQGTPMTCHISYGGGSKSEPWDRFLMFNVDSDTNKIIQESLKCVDVP